MAGKSSEENKTVVQVPFVRPYNFALSTSAVHSFQPGQSPKTAGLRLPVRIGETPVVIEVTSSGADSDTLTAVSRPACDPSQVRNTVDWVLFLDLDLAPFYRKLAAHPKLAALPEKLHGLKPSRPASLFEMAVTAITEQQISLAAAYRIRDRLVQRFGEPVEDLRVFPRPEALAAAAPEELRSCGLSGQKIRYIKELAGRIMEGSLDIDSLKQTDDEGARQTIMSWKGFGAWSADYILIRGLARPDSVPAEDIGIREVVGRYLNEGPRATAQEVTELLESFRPYRGLLAFYLLVYKRLFPDE